ncbi:MAG TPA: tyrosine-type recombinase/integrase, partial [Segeticoccus sp.]|nr:tyrosine-type recombinase/integrase [Segeticoccus sp.]
DLLFGSERGGPLRVRNMRRDWFDAAAVAAGVPGLTPHELRHTAASMAVSAGASVLALQRMLGHDKPSTTLDVYSDLFDEDLDDVAHRLSEARARTREAKTRPTAASEASPPASAGP